MCLCVSGSLQMKRVKFQTRLEPEYINNFKLVQAAFNRMGVTQVSDATKVLADSRQEESGCVKSVVAKP